LNDALELGEPLELGDTRWKLVVSPSLGGSLLACQHDGVAVLKPVLQPAGDGRPPIPRCCFPMIPFANRVENSRFTFDGVTVRLTPNVAGSPHAMHGHGWQAAWQLRERDAASCTLAFEHVATPAWPWPYRASEHIAIEHGALRLTLTIENLGIADMPCGLGFHPFLPRTRDARLALEASHVWNGSAASFPMERIAVTRALDFRDARRVADREGIDHCFDNWRGRATVQDAESRYAFAVDGCEATRFVILYIPAGADYFCVEPVTHAVNAMSRPDDADSGLWRLEPGERRRIHMTITPQNSPRPPRRTSARNP
jgi:aldose 1-epimerase